MRPYTCVLLALISGKLLAQSTPTEKAQPIVQEGKRLYRSEMASWYGTDLFTETYKGKGVAGGYLSYDKGDSAICIFFSKEDNAKVIGQISFDSTYSTTTAIVDLSEREFNTLEKDLYTIRQSALKEIIADTALFKRYQNTSLNLIPIIYNNEKKVYVLTGPQQNGVVIIGNDYLLTYDAGNNLITKKRLHMNIIPIYYGGKPKEGEEAEPTMHTHLPETGEFMTATDICTLMLYEKFTKWKQHNVISKDYLNIWNCDTNELLVIPMSTIKKINNDQEKRNKKKKRNDD